VIEKTDFPFDFKNMSKMAVCLKTTRMQTLIKMNEIRLSIKRPAKLTKP
jgi:hypothetical protein